MNELQQVLNELTKMGATVMFNQKHSNMEATVMYDSFHTHINLAYDDLLEGLQRAKNGVRIRQEEIADNC